MWKGLENKYHTRFEIISFKDITRLIYNDDNTLILGISKILFKQLYLPTFYFHIYFWSKLIRFMRWHIFFNIFNLQLKKSTNKWVFEIVFLWELPNLFWFMSFTQIDHVKKENIHCSFKYWGCNDAANRSSILNIECTMEIASHRMQLWNLF